MTNPFRGGVAVAALLAGLLGGAAAPAAAQAPVVEYYHLDALGSVRVVTDASGAVVRRHDYTPYGEEVNVTYPNPDRKLFTGQEHDSETGLDYFGARYYRAGIGRFTTVDPAMTIQENLVDPQRWNRYGYARNNPLRYTDPDGRVPVVWSGGPDLTKLQAEYSAARGLARVWAGVRLALAYNELMPPSGAIIVKGAGAVESGLDLAARATAIHRAVGAVTQTKTTIAAAEVVTGEGATKVMIGSSEFALRPGQRALLQAGEQAVTGVGHAETTVLNAAAAEGSTVTAIAASRPICPACQEAIKQVGAMILSLIKQ